MQTESQRQLPGTTLFSDRAEGLRIDAVQGFPDAAESLIDETVWGTGDVLYRVDGMAQALRKQPSANYLLLTKHEQLAAMIYLHPKIAENRNRHWMAIYSSILIVDPQYRSRGYGKLLKQQSLEYIANIGGAR
jgi:GNAT superfamily N-acetyltransferase